MKNVIEFPNRNGLNNLKMRREQRQSTRQAILSLSMVTLIMGAILLNDSIQRRSQVYLISDNSQSESLVRLNRAIASAQPANPFRDFEWEKSLAKRLADDRMKAVDSAREIAHREPASISQKVESLDQLRFGILEGRYSVKETKTTGGLKISQIDFIDTEDIGIQPVAVRPETILSNFGREFAVSFSKFDRANHLTQDNVQEFRLLNDASEVLGLVSFAYDDDGKLLSMKVKSSPK